MIERVVENWLTSATERTYQEPFSQLLLVEGFDVLQGPVHHPFEHGKDIIAVDPHGRLCAFQLKTGDLSLAGIRSIQDQLLTMISTAVSYPGKHQGSPAERAVLVTNGNLSPHARDHLRAFNEANTARDLAQIELVEKESLVGRFSKVQSGLVALDDLKNLLELLTADGRGPFMTSRLLGLLQGALDAPKEGASATRRTIASGLLATAYAATSWGEARNYLAVAEAWLAGALGILRAAEAQSLDSEVWTPSYELAFSAARSAVNEAVIEACSREDLLVEDITECFVYSTRALEVCGWASAFFLSERALQPQAPGTDLVEDLLRREHTYIRVCGEAGAPLLFVIAKALEKLGNPSASTSLVAGWLGTLALLNRPTRSGELSAALPNPYTPLQEAVLLPYGLGTSQIPMERFEGRSYTAHQALDWLARRDLRGPVEELFPGISRLLLVDVQPSELLSLSDDSAKTVMRALPCPSSWAGIHRDALAAASRNLPATIDEHPEIIPYLGLVLPHRFNRHLAGVLDSRF